MIFLVDDDPIQNMLTSQLLEMNNGNAEYIVYNNGKEVIEGLESGIQPKVILLDINMPIMNGIETTAWITENYPITNVMALSVEDADATILKMLKAGAIGYLLKDTEKSVLEHALVEVVENGFFHTKNVTNLLMQSISGNGQDVIKFKERELTFMKLACTELTYKEIADKMCLSPKTIDGYRDVLFTKLNVRNRVGLVMYAIKNKIYTL